jgi:hypothetical protein
MNLSSKDLNIIFFERLDYIKYIIITHEWKINGQQAVPLILSEWQNQTFLDLNQNKNLFSVPSTTPNLSFDAE